MSKKMRQIVARLSELTRPFARAGARIGIVGHLVLAFAVVSAFAIAANLFAQHGTLLIEKTDTVIIQEPVSVPLQVIPAAAPAQRAVEPSPVKISSTQLLAAIDLHHRQALARAEVPGADNEEAFIRAAENLRAETAKFATAGRGSVDSRQMEDFSSRVRSHEAAAANLVRMADARRELVSQYRQHFEAMDSQMKASVDRAWKIFGRVIARESLIQLSRDLDALRPTFTNGSAIGDASEPDMATLAASLSAFAASLDSSRASLARSQGEDWVERMGAGHASLVDIHGKVLAADSELRNANEVVASGSASLAQLARTIKVRVPKPQGWPQCHR